MKLKIAVLLAIAVITAFSAVACDGREKAGSSDTGVPSTGSYEVYPALKSYIGNDKWGYIDKKGRFAIQPVFSQAGRFQANQLAVAGRDGKVGLIDRSGRFAAAPVYNYINDYSEGLAVASDDEGYIILDEAGRVISEKYAYIKDFKSKRAVYSIQTTDGKSLSGYLDEKGEPVTEPVFEYASDFEGDRAVVRLASGAYALIDREGNAVKTFKYPYVGSVADGRVGFQAESGGKYGYMDIKGNVAIQPVYTYAYDFAGGSAIVNTSSDPVNDRLGLIDTNGRILLEPGYNDIVPLGEERAAAGVPIDPKSPFIGSRFALASAKGDGRVLTDFVFYNIDRFRGGLASASDGNETFFIDTAGSRVDNLPSAKGAGRLERLGSLIYADVDRRSFYMNEEGDIIYKPSSCGELNGGIKVCEEKYKPNMNFTVYYPVLEDLGSLKTEDDINTKLRDMWTNADEMTVKPADVLDYRYESDFSIGFNRKDLLVLMKSGYDYPFGAAHGMPVQEYAHINTATGAFYELEELFRDESNYVGILEGIIEKQISEHAEEMGIWPDSFKGIKRDQPFYLTEDALSIYFRPYEIAPYAAGFPTFAIPFDEISDIIDKKGEFWLAFN